MQAIAAVHESGHAILSIFLLHTIPEVIYSKTADALTEGFVYSDFKWNYISKKEILSRIAIFLGGIIAEKIIFGEENITNGSESDIEKATHFVTGMLKESGMGKLPGNFQVADTSTNNNLFDLKNKINDQASKLIVDAKKLGFLALRVDDKTISGKAAKEVLDYLMENDEDIDSVIDKLGLKQMSDTGAIESICDEIIAANPDKVEQYKGGKEKLFGFFVGQVMKASKGSANPQAVNEILKVKLG